MSTSELWDAVTCERSWFWPRWPRQHGQGTKKSGRLSPQASQAGASLFNVHPGDQ